MLQHNLHSLLQSLPHKVLQGNIAMQIMGVAIDSRLVQNGFVFVAIKGEKTDGHLFIDKAIALGATVIVVQDVPSTLVENIVYLKVENSHKAAAVLAHHYYNEPSKQLKLVGVTGTNGKTTIATLLYKLFTQLGFTCGLISTVENIIGITKQSSTHTTPDAVSISELIYTMQQQGCTHVFMECSSHAIHQYRIAGLHFTGAIFSNITHDHLDYHKTFDEYIKVKKTFFDELPSTAFAITNADDKRGNVMLQNCAASKYRYGLYSVADYKAKIVENGLSGLQLIINNQHQVHCRLIGEFNAYNFLAVFAASVCLGINDNESLTTLSNLQGAEGRFDYVIGSNKVVGIVDYAHTPDALENVLQTIKQLSKSKQQIITVVGCGGDRDKTKRPIMANIACKLSNKVVLTSDNPRTENASSILNDMERGVHEEDKKKVIVIEDRKQAIRTAVLMANAEDVILVAGKGHEKYQEINGIKHPFDDKDILKELLAT